MFIVLFGIQGSGKGTQGELLAKKLDIPHLSTGDILRSIAAQDTDEGRAMKTMLEQGTYLGDAEMAEILCKHLPKNVILDGYPRTLDQAKTLDTIAHVDTVIYIDLHEEAALDRMLKRARSDDTPDAIHKRFMQYHAQADAILDYYLKQGKILDVNGDQSIEQVFAELCMKMNL